LPLLFCFCFSLHRMLAQVRCQNLFLIFLGGSLGCFCNSTACNFFSLKMLHSKFGIGIWKRKKGF
jgi:hypothetical protein